LLEKLDSDKENILFFPSTAQVQVIDAIARLNASRFGKRITLVGLNEWNSFENIEYEHLNNLNFTYSAPWYIDYNTAEAKKFRSLYRNEFKGEPGVYAFQGYDAMMYFAESASRLNTLNTECLTKLPPYNGFCTEFKFKKENTTSGADNNHVYVLQLSDYLAAPINKP
jgi:ABC-type branched-subunit amino acid transport system substrate-binding protein